jgi:hypothetical protein
VRVLPAAVQQHQLGRLAAPAQPAEHGVASDRVDPPHRGGPVGRDAQLAAVLGEQVQLGDLGGQWC